MSSIVDTQFDTGGIRSSAQTQTVRKCKIRLLPDIFNVAFHWNTIIMIIIVNYVCVFLATIFCNILSYTMCLHSLFSKLITAPVGSFYFLENCFVQVTSCVVCQYLCKTWKVEFCENRNLCKLFLSIIDTRLSCFNVKTNCFMWR